MKLKFLRTPGGFPEYREGTAHEVDAEAAEPFVAAGIAVEVADKPAPARKPDDKKPDDKK